MGEYTIIATACDSSNTILCIGSYKFNPITFHIIIILYLSSIILPSYFLSSIYRELVIQRSTKCGHCTAYSCWIQTAEAKEVP